MDHDQVFKTFIQQRLQTVLETFLPEIAQQVDASQPDWLEKQYFTDLLKGRRKEADLVALVPLRNHPQQAFLLFHIEVEGRRRKDFLARMFLYYMILRLKFGLMVFPLVIYLSPTRFEGSEEEYREGALGREFVVFRFPVVRLGNLSADDYLSSSNLTEVALSVKMRPSAMGKVRHKLLALQLIAQSRENAAQKELLAQFVEIYTPLSVSEAEEYANLLESEGTQEVKEMISVYRQEGRKEGRLQGERQVLLMQLNTKFGKLPKSWEQRIAKIEDEAQLQAMLKRVLTANSLKEMESAQ